MDGRIAFVGTAKPELTVTACKHLFLRRTRQTVLPSTQKWCHTAAAPWLRWCRRRMNALAHNWIVYHPLAFVHATSPPPLTSISSIIFLAFIFCFVQRVVLFHSCTWAFYLFHTVIRSFHRSPAKHSMSFTNQIEIISYENCMVLWSLLVLMAMCCWVAHGAVGAFVVHRCALLQQFFKCAPAPASHYVLMHCARFSRTITLAWQATLHRCCLRRQKKKTHWNQFMWHSRILMHSIRHSQIQYLARAATNLW